MRISTINNTNFNGKFLKTMALDELLASADKNTLGRFNEVLTRAAKINDNEIFIISSRNALERESYGDFVDFHYNLHKYPKNNAFGKQFLDKVSFRVKRDLDFKESVYKKTSEVLEAFLPMLEALYPKNNYPETRRELLENIYSQLERENHLK